ncbi:Crp/Fnr family transcriptional regulator [Bacillus sp. V5-8f]|uniref:Crp/Fnr family transcriptional regulator n=1 Tax=Bacillus sp. V5-8f TaxID=2053044 RepID=UPI000C75AE9F|nr:Crp/Fnr family transcriptional regulator [Bacillus sp. V5-8f]PLT33850.1 Crp/Fnr family transcriptional regulator [Bacillus sp. V5-8f]
MQTSVPLRLKEILESNQHARKMKKGEFLFQEDTNAQELFLILSGTVQISKLVPDGRELTLRVSSRDEIVGETILFSSSSKYFMNAKMIQEGEVIVIQKNELEEKIALDGGLAVDLMRWLSVQHRKTQTKFRDLILHGKKGALYSTLLRLSNSFGIQTQNGIVINLPLTNQELANFCGTSREVVNRLLSDLRKKGIISIKKGTITIHEIQYLKIEIDCENCPAEICNIE